MITFCVKNQMFLLFLLKREAFKLLKVDSQLSTFVLCLTRHWDPRLLWCSAAKTFFKTNHSYCQRLFHYYVAGARNYLITCGMQLFAIWWFCKRCHFRPTNLRTFILVTCRVHEMYAFLYKSYASVRILWYCFSCY